MKFLRYGTNGRERPALLDSQHQIRDLGTLVSDLDGKALSRTNLDRLRSVDASDLPIVAPPVRIAPCVTAVGKIVCIGLNYLDHAAESESEAPQEPVLFLKSTTAITGPNDNIILPPGSRKLDWEVELGVIIGRRATRIDKEQSLEHVAGYCIINDISERDFQLERGGQWVKGKSFDSFAPIGPWVVTKDEIPDPQCLSMSLEVNGFRYQESNTNQMIFTVKELISYVSQFMTLEPGDILSTGTPAGVGLGQTPPVYLRAGDVVVVAIEGLGEQRQTVSNYGDKS